MINVQGLLYARGNEADCLINEPGGIIPPSQTVSSESSERTMSKLKMVKKQIANQLIRQHFVNVLIVASDYEHDFLQQLNNSDIINQMAIACKPFAEGASAILIHDRRLKRLASSSVWRYLIYFMRVYCMFH